MLFIASIQDNMHKKVMQTNYHIGFVNTAACCVTGQAILKKSIPCFKHYCILPAKTINKGCEKIHFIQINIKK